MPFKKDIEFDSISEIKSISLEHTLSLKDNLISGSFIISGTYKITDQSVNLDEFNFDLPFNISVDGKYDTSNVKIDINDFYYELKNNNILTVNIEVLIDNLELKEIKQKNDNKEELKPQNDVRNDMREEFDTLEEELSNKDDVKEENIEEKQTLRDNEEIEEEVMSSIFDSISDSENYVTYKVHVVTESDTIETIIQKYEVPLSKLEDYNTLTDLKTGDKIIIPS